MWTWNECKLRMKGRLAWDGYVNDAGFTDDAYFVSFSVHARANCHLHDAQRGSTYRSGRKQFQHSEKCRSATLTDQVLIFSSTVSARNASESMLEQLFECFGERPTSVSLLQPLLKSTGYVHGHGISCALCGTVAKIACCTRYDPCNICNSACLQWAPCRLYRMGICRCTLLTTQAVGPGGPGCRSCTFGNLERPVAMHDH